MKRIFGQTVSHLLGCAYSPKKYRHISYKMFAYISMACQPIARVRDVRPHQLVSEEKSLESSIIPDIIGQILNFENKISTMNYLPVL